MHQLGRRAFLNAIAASATGACRSVAAAATVEGGEQLPIASFAEKPAMSGLVLSPDGTSVLARVQVRGKEMLGSYVIATGKLETYSLPPKTDLVWYRWAGSGRFLVSLAHKFFAADSSGMMQWSAEGYATRLACFDIGSQKALFIGLKAAGFRGDNVLFVDPDGAFILLSVQRSIFEPPYVYRLSLENNTQTLIVRPAPGVRSWYTDTKGVVRGGLGYDGKQWFITYRPQEDAPFRRIDGGDNGVFGRVPVAEMSFVAGSDEGYILSNKQTGRYAVYKYNFALHTLGELVHENASNDISDLDFDEAGHKLEAIRYTDDRERVVWIDPLLKDVQDAVDRAMPNRINRIASRSFDNRTMLVHTSGPGDLGKYYIFSLADTKLHRLLDMGDKLPPARLARMDTVTYRARDGLTIPAYLTLPKGREKGLPLVIMPHGGPYGVRSTLGFDAEVQFLANRGYAVLQPNYRGSDGYGLDFHKRGEGEWGRKMQDDLDDGMDWLVGRGIIDPKRACLVGSSYGGYAAAWGATRNPERYRCGASFAGVFDLRTQLAYTSSFLTSDHYREFRSTVKGPGDFDLDAVSPLRRVAELKVPILLVHGDDDSTVPVTQTRSYEAALTKAGKPHEALIIPNEGHGFRETGSMIQWFSRLESFLKNNNPA